MKLLTESIKKELSNYPLYSQDGTETDNKVVICKFFNPCGAGTWYVTEGEEQEDGDWLFFGFVELLDSEWGYFTLKELESVKLPFGMGIERDTSFTKKLFSEI